ncbi:hypothetical protein D3C76_518300 [compost metagenome]
MVEAFATWCLLDVGELGRAVFQHYAGFQALDHLVVDFTTHTYRVLTVHLVGRVHQAVGQFTVGGEQQQAGGVDVQAADVDPAAAAQTRQAVEYGRTAFRIVAGADLAFRLVIDQHAAHVLLGCLAADQVIVHGDGITGVDALAKGRDGAVDLDPTLLDPGFHVAARADAHAREDLLQLFAGGGRGEFLVFVRVVHLGTSRCVMQRRKGAHHTRLHAPTHRP